MLFSLQSATHSKSLSSVTSRFIIHRCYARLGLKLAAGLVTGK